MCDGTWRGTHKWAKSIDNLLSFFGVNKSSLIGSGVEAEVFALNKKTVLRVNRKGSSKSDVTARVELLNRMMSGSQQVRFEIPTVTDFGFKFGLHFTIENRLSGIPLSDGLEQQSGSKRAALIDDYLEISTQLSRLLIGDVTYGELGLGEPIRNPCFKSFLRQRAQQSLDVCQLDIDLESILDAINDPSQPELVHLDYCPSNVMCSEGKITGVLDFGGTTVTGSSAFNPVVATTFLDPTITPVANANDHHQALDWLESFGHSESNLAMKKWLAAYWSFCGKDKDLPLFRWCRRTLNV